MVIGKCSDLAGKRLAFSVLVMAFLFAVAGQAQDGKLQQALAEPLMPIEQVDTQFKSFVQKRIKKLELPASSKLWAKEAEEIRTQVLEEVVFKGVPQTWRKMRVSVQKLKTLETPHGYSIERMLIEALPGMWIPALIYLPDGLDGARVPAVLNVNGPAPEGKAYLD